MPKGPEGAPISPQYLEWKSSFSSLKTIVESENKNLSGVKEGEETKSRTWKLGKVFRWLNCNNRELAEEIEGSELTTRKVFETSESLSKSRKRQHIEAEKPKWMLHEVMWWFNGDDPELLEEVGAEGSKFVTKEVLEAFRQLPGSAHKGRQIEAESHRIKNERDFWLLEVKDSKLAEKIEATSHKQELRTVFRWLNGEDSELAEKIETGEIKSMEGKFFEPLYEFEKEEIKAEGLAWKLREGSRWLAYKYPEIAEKSETDRLKWVEYERIKLLQKDNPTFVRQLEVKGRAFLNEKFSKPLSESYEKYLKAKGPKQNGK